MFGNLNDFLGNHHGWNKQGLRGVDNPRCVTAIRVKNKVVEVSFGESENQELVRKRVLAFCHGGSWIAELLGNMRFTSSGKN